MINIQTDKKAHKHYVIQIKLIIILSYSKFESSGLPTMNGVGDSSTSASTSGQRGIYGHCQQNGNIIYINNIFIIHVYNNTTPHV